MSLGLGVLGKFEFQLSLSQICVKIREVIDHFYRCVKHGTVLPILMICGESNVRT